MGSALIAAPEDVFGEDESSLYTPDGLFWGGSALTAASEGVFQRNQPSLQLLSTFWGDQPSSQTPDGIF